MQYHILTRCRTHGESMQSIDEMMLELRDLLSEMSGKGMTIALHPTKHMDVYLEPLINELEELWRGVAVVDISRPPSSRHFDLKAVLM